MFLKTPQVVPESSQVRELKHRKSFFVEFTASVRKNANLKQKSVCCRAGGGRPELVRELHSHQVSRFLPSCAAVTSGILVFRLPVVEDDPASACLGSLSQATEKMR